MFPRNCHRLSLVCSLFALGLILTIPAPVFAAEFEGKLDFFGDMDWEPVHKEAAQENNSGLANPEQPGFAQTAPSGLEPVSVSPRNGSVQQFAPTSDTAERRPNRGPQEVMKTTEVTIQLEKKMPAMQSTGDKPFLGPDPLEKGFFEPDPFAEEKEPIPELKDPIEGINRSIYDFNDKVYENLLRPVAETYRDLIHEEVRIAIRNLFNNAFAPVKLFSSLVQLNFEKSGRVISRTFINTVFGWGGMLDVAGQEYGIKDVNEDFNQALGYHGVGSGPYIVLPFLGPTTTRGIVGRVVDSFLSPTIIAAPGFAAGAAMSGSRMVNDTSFRIEDIEQLKKDAIDPYVSMRDFYHQYTERQILK